MTGLDTAFEAVQKPMPDDLFEAAARGDVEKVAAMLECGADLNKKCHGYPPLVIAAERGHFAVVSFLLDKGADINAKNSYDHTALIAAVEASGSVDVARLLIERGAALDETILFNGSTALMRAAGNEHVEILRMLIEALADLDKKTTDSGETALSRAEYLKRLSIEVGDVDEVRDEILQMLRDAPAIQEKIRQVRLQAIKDHEMHDRIAIKQQRFKARAASRKVIPGGIQ